MPPAEVTLWASLSLAQGPGQGRCPITVYRTGRPADAQRMIRFLTSTEGRAIVAVKWDKISKHPAQGLAHRKHLINSSDQCHHS